MRIPLLLLALMLLSACGQKGPLTLPDDKAPQQATTAPSPDQDDNEREQDKQ